MKLAKRLLTSTEYISYLSRRLLYNIYYRITQIQNELVTETIEYEDDGSYEDDNNQLVAMNSRFIEFNSSTDIEHILMLNENFPTKDITHAFINPAERIKSIIDLMYNNRGILFPTQNLLALNCYGSSIEVGDFALTEGVNSEELKINRKRLVGLNNNNRKLCRDFEVFNLEKLLKDISENGKLVEEGNLKITEDQCILCENSNVDQTEALEIDTNILRYFPSDDYENVRRVMEVNEEQFKKLDNFLEGLESEQDEREEKEEEQEEEKEDAESEEPPEPDDQDNDDSPVVQYSIDDLLVKGNNGESVLRTSSKFVNSSSNLLLKQSNHAGDKVGQSLQDSFQLTMVSGDDNCFDLFNRDNAEGSLIAQAFSNPVNSIFNFYFSASNINPVGKYKWNVKDDEIYYSNEAISNCSNFDEFDTVDRQEDQFQFENKDQENYLEVDADSTYVTENRYGFDFKKNLYNILSNKYEKRVSDTQKSSGFDLDKINYYVNILQNAEKKPSILMRNYYPPSDEKYTQSKKGLHSINQRDECFLPSKYCVEFTSSKVNPQIFEPINTKLNNFNVINVEDVEKTEGNAIKWPNGDNTESQIEYFSKLSSESVDKFAGDNAILKTVTSKILRSFIKDKLVSIKKSKEINEDIMSKLIQYQYEKHFGSVFYKEQMSSGNTFKNTTPNTKPTNQIKKKRQYKALSNLTKTGKIHYTVEQMLILCNPYLRTIPQQYINLSALEKFFNLSILRHVPDVNEKEELTYIWKYFSYFIINRQPTNNDVSKQPFVTNSKIVFQLLKVMENIKQQPNYLQQVLPYPKCSSKNQCQSKSSQKDAVMLQRTEFTPQEVAKLLDTNMKQFYKLEKKLTRNLLINQNFLKTLENSGCFSNNNVELTQTKRKEMNIVNRTRSPAVKNIEDLIILTDKRGGVYKDLQV